MSLQINKGTVLNKEAQHEVKCKGGTVNNSECTANKR